MATALTKPFANPFCRHPQKLPNQNLNRRWGTKSLAAGAAAALLSGSLACPLSAEESFLDIIETSSQDLRRFTKVGECGPCSVAFGNILTDGSSESNSSSDAKHRDEIFLRI